jgi:hypothetical protein
MLTTMTPTGMTYAGFTTRNSTNNTATTTVIAR